MLDGWEIDLYAIISSFPKGSNTLMTSDHDRQFLNPPIGWEMSGGPTSFYSRLPWIRASMSKNGWESYMKSTWHPYMSKNEWYLVVTMIFWLENPNRLSDWKNEMKTTMSRITLLVICSMSSSCFPLKKNLVWMSSHHAMWSRLFINEMDFSRSRPFGLPTTTTHNSPKSFFFSPSHNPQSRV